ncbi:MAG: radical SAM protein [Alphaproteobacteria bacterium]|nr:radical SAM protein [Alphaproteobacteria bacterium]
MPPDPRKVLIITGGMFSLTEPSVARAASRQLASLRASKAGWLDLHLKLTAVERVLTMRRFMRSAAYARAPYTRSVEACLGEDPSEGVPELTEVVLAGLLEAEGLAYEVCTWSELHVDAARRAALLEACGVLFASTTLVRDVSELQPLLAPLKRPDNVVVAGGALVGMLHAGWTPIPEVDLLAVGWGERLVPALARWIRSGFTELVPPEGGRLEHRGPTPCLIAGLPEARSLDALPAPDWALAERVHGRRFTWVSYESVRGCPYRCAFCNYPFLFDDTKFRVRSAERILEDWTALAAQGVQWVSCLDSLFTMPKKRLIALCEGLIERDLGLCWICYARAGDLGDPAVVRLLRDAGCRQVQIGVESGSQLILDNMNKRAKVADNELALRNCREQGLSTLITLIVGYPGETEATIAETEASMRRSPPDFFFITPFSTKFPHVPVLEPESRARFGLLTHYDGWSAFPAWRHDTMDVLTACDHTRALTRRFMADGVALEAGIFYGRTLGFRAEMRDELLRFQAELVRYEDLSLKMAAQARVWSRKKSAAEIERVLG